MDTEWSVAAGDDDPVIVVPWADEDGKCAFIDLRAHPDRIAEIPEATSWPELRNALLLLNANHAGTFTAKCDAWELSEEEKSLDFGPVACGIGSYIDVFFASSEVFASLETHLAIIRRITAALANADPQDARAEFIVRPAQNEDAIGFAITVYSYGYGEQMAEAYDRWVTALTHVVQAIQRETLE